MATSDEEGRESTSSMVSCIQCKCVFLCLVLAVCTMHVYHFGSDEHKPQRPLRRMHVNGKTIDKCCCLQPFRAQHALRRCANVCTHCTTQSCRCARCSHNEFSRSKLVDVNTLTVSHRITSHIDQLSACKIVSASDAYGLCVCARGSTDGLC